MANTSIQSPGPDNLKWTIAHLRTPGVSELAQTAPIACLIVFIGTANAASVVKALNLEAGNNLNGSSGNNDGELALDLPASDPHSVRPTTVSRSLASIEIDHIERV